MAVDFFTIEKGLEMVQENSSLGVKMLFGNGAPGGEAVTDVASLGSVFQRMDNNGEFYRKKTAGSGADKWKRMADEDDILSIGFRNEKVVAATGDVAPAEGGTIDLSSAPFGDDEAPLLAGSDFVVGDYVIFGVGGTPVLAKISNIAVDVLTFTYVGVDPLVDNNRFVCRHYLPDSPDSQEKSALIYYTGVDIEKLGDINWDFADGINTSAGYLAATGNPVAGDDVELMLEKIDGNIDSIDLRDGLAQGATHYGTFTGGLLSDNVSAKVLFQELETEVESITDALGVRSSATNVTSAITLDSILVDDFVGAEWMVVFSLDSNPAQRQSVKITSIHDGTAAADASSVDYDKYAINKLGSSFNNSISIDVSGAGAAQIMRLRVSASAAISVSAYRTDVKTP